MCGIAGIVSLKEGLAPPSREALARMADALRHRGPDASGVYRDRRAGLAHARLSIIDLSGGAQPLSNEDGSLWIAYNGEIFNYVELRAELEALGHRFRTRSDTEVAVHAYEAWGDASFARYDGQFAIALWDATRGALVLARDRLGVRPLHVCEHGGRVYFGSEVKAIFAADPAIPRALDPIGIEQTFTFWSVVAPRTAFEGVEELPPGYVRTYARGDRVERPFARIRFPEGGEGLFSGSIEDATAAVRGALREATRLRMLRADVPVGSYLSGGLDSSIVAAMGLEAKGGARFSTFSLRFEDAEYDETSFQRLVAARLGTDHHEIVVSRRDIAEVLPDVVLHAERPILRTAPAPLFLLSKLVRASGIKVVLTGEGADEVFAGYDLFREGKVRRFWARHPASSQRPLLLARLYPYLARSPTAQQAIARQFFGQGLAGAASPGFAHDPRWRSAAALRRLFSPRLTAAIGARDVRAELLASLPPELPRWSALAQDQYLEMRTLLAGYILASQGDRMLMAHGVEGRFPFLDTGVVELASSLPPAYKLRVLDEKHVLKRVAEGLVPEAIIARKKQPYRAPDALAFSGLNAPAWIEEVTSDRAIAAAGVFDPGAVARLLRKCRDAGHAAQFSNADNMAVVGVLSTQLLHAGLVERPSAARAAAPDTVIDRVAPEGESMLDPPLLLHDYLLLSARRLPEKVALVARGARFTYREIDARSNQLARALARRGVLRGDRVMIFSDNTVETVVAFWAALKADAIASIVSPQTKADKLAYLLGDSRAAALVTDARLAPAFVPAAAGSQHLCAIIVSGATAEATGLAVTPWDEALAGEDPGAPPPRRNISRDLASIIYTSGSTGEPKGVMLTHGNMLAAATSITTYLENVEDDVILGVLPLSFDYGLYQMIMAFRMGARLVLERSFAYPAEVLKVVANEGVTGFPGVPTMFAILAEMKNLSDYDLRAIRYVTNTAAALAPKHITALQRIFPGARIFSMYGLTECKRCTYLPPADLDKKPASVGIAIPNTELWLVDDQDRRLGPGQVGQLVIRGDTVMRGYWEKPEATDERLRPGPLPGEMVLYTGDYCRLDEEGYLYFVGRMDSILKVRGEKVAPKEIEVALVEIPGVKEAAVIGVPDEILGEAPKAFVVLEAGAELGERDLRRECQARLEAILVPKWFQIVPSLPKTTTGKIMKKGLV